MEIIEEKQPLVSITGVLVEEKYGPWMQVKSKVKSRPQNADSVRAFQSKEASSVRTDGKEIVKGGGSRFNILQHAEPVFKSKEQMKSHKEKDGEMRWRRKEKDQQFVYDTDRLKGKGLDTKNLIFVNGKPSCVGEQMEVTRSLEKIENGQVGGDKMRLKGKSKVGPDDVSKMEGVIRGNAYGPNQQNEVGKELGSGLVLVDKPIEIASTLACDGNKRKNKKGALLNGPRIAVPNFKRKHQQGQIHSVVFGSASNKGSLKWDQLIPQVKDSGKSPCVDLDRELLSKQTINLEHTRLPESAL